MKTFSVFVLFCLCLGLVGCDTVGTDFKTSVREKFEGPTYRTKVVTADARTAYEAVRQSSEKLGFRFVRGGPAQGRFEALSGLSAGDSLKSTRQLSMVVKLSPAATGTELAVLITEQVEDDFNKGAGQATETPLRDTPLYDVFFRNVEQALAVK